MEYGQRPNSFCSFILHKCSRVDSAMTAGVIGFGLYMAMIVMIFFVKPSTPYILKMVSSLLINVAFSNSIEFLLHYDNNRAWLDLSLVNTPITVRTKKYE